MDNLIRDIRSGFRSLRKRPGFTAIAIVTLALGIGANTAIFSLVNTVLLRPLPVPKAEQIVSVALRGKTDPILAFSYPNYKDFRDRNQVLSGLLVYRFVPISLSRSGNNERIWGYEVSGNYFDMLGVQAFKGRTFLPEEDRTRLSHPVAVISYGTWQKRFGADPDLVGKEVLLNNHPFKIVGIAPEGFKGTELVYTPELWVPLSMLEWIEPGSLSLVGGTIGFWLVFWIINLLLAFRPPIDFPLTMDLSVDWRVLLFAFGVSLLTSVLSGVSATDPATFIVVSVLLIAVFLLASYLPARRATKVEIRNPPFEIEPQI